MACPCPGYRKARCGSSALLVELTVVRPRPRVKARLVTVSRAFSLIFRKDWPLGRFAMGLRKEHWEHKGGDDSVTQITIEHHRPKTPPQGI